MFLNKKHPYWHYFQGQVRELWEVQQTTKADKTEFL